MSYQRFAIYHVPPQGALSAFGAAWLGWDVTAGCPSVPLAVPERDAVTATAHRYGFHATLKPPFRLGEGCALEGLSEAVSTLARRLSPARCDGLALGRMGRFLALLPVGDATGLNHLAAACVTQLDAFRASPTAEEFSRRRGSGLRPELEANLTNWGYPYVLSAYRFHMTLTDRLPAAALPDWEVVLADLLPPLPAPFEISGLALVGERADGRFEVIDTFPLAG
ncbi:protein of unknown function DUF1045 [Dinoroseobacter shibae DFL 12 = DSM 16493]|jgi:hypothetical protein|uniref:Phosphonate metabolism protein n=1 Tax=Dinoroseobacter shibae (strain DSM 16493 / NCIMB 14021 / DFL 12) TaxID=398580 RepID=A8LNX6_DINSH|nr:MULTISPECIES: DUF1045 domain-containing protein [Dinoroseobacter]ABV92284.1 protein of unknown function DUF1045 [Dinoroseobacter shibae DFL 12 = DSM 16493]MDD9717488.1 DUF1045 domain-containing protein [Dinoroseobacter sp. PD6]URF47238.1 DUF1045 domain-containing protein [Dinoroseobacter shibae]URF51549.1 DUF1045 domain-containing protein [Dinoroseobacter shibae]